MRNKLKITLVIMCAVLLLNGNGRAMADNSEFLSESRRDEPKKEKTVKNFIELTRTSGSKFIININTIRMVAPNPSTKGRHKGRSIVTLSDVDPKGQAVIISPKETYSTVLELIRESSEF